MQDLLVSGGSLSKEYAKKWHSAGHKIWSYGNPQGGEEKPEEYRLNFGLMLWKNNYDGACTYAYQHSFGNGWNDFDDSEYRDHNFAYPALDGVIDTIEWEGYREGINDVRYLTTLLEKIEQSKKLKSDDRKMVIKETEQFLENMNVQKGSLYTIRSEIVSNITKLWIFNTQLTI